MKVSFHKKKMMKLLVLGTALFALGKPAPAAVTVGVNVQSSTGGDVSVAAGPNNVMEYSNFTFTIFTKNGTVLKSTALNDFWAPLGGNAVSDCHVLYDVLAKRWVADGIGPNNYTYFGVSDTSDPTGPWSEMHSFSMTGSLPDGAAIGYNADAYVINGWSGAGCAIINKSSVLDKNNGTFTWTEYANQNIWGQLAYMPDSKSGGAFWSWGDGDANGIYLWKLTNVTSGNAAFTKYYVPTTLMNGGNNPAGCAVPVRNGKMLVTTTLNNNSGVGWCVIDLTGSSPVVVQGGDFYAPSGYSIGWAEGGLDANGDIGIEYEQWNGNSNSMYVTGRASSDPANTLQPAVLVKSANNVNGVGGQDYVSCTDDIDSNGNSIDGFWAGNVVDDGSNSWYTRIVNFSVSGGGGGFSGAGTYVLSPYAAPGSALNDPSYSTTDPTQMVIWAKGGGGNEKFNFVDIGGGFYKVQCSFSTGQVLDAYGAGNNAVVGIWTDNGQNQQKWQVVSVGGGYYNLKPGNASTMALDNSNGASGNGNPLVLWPNDPTSNNQKWSFTKQ